MSDTAFLVAPRIRGLASCSGHRVRVRFEDLTIRPTKGTVLNLKSPDELSLHGLKRLHRASCLPRFSSMVWAVFFSRFRDLQGPAAATR